MVAPLIPAAAGVVGSVLIRVAAREAVKRGTTYLIKRGLTAAAAEAAATKVVETGATAIDTAFTAALISTSGSDEPDHDAETQDDRGEETDALTWYHQPDLDAYRGAVGYGTSFILAIDFLDGQLLGIHVLFSWMAVADGGWVRMEDQTLAPLTPTLRTNIVRRVQRVLDVASAFATDRLSGYMA